MKKKKESKRNLQNETDLTLLKEYDRKMALPGKGALFAVLTYLLLIYWYNTGLALGLFWTVVGLGILCYILKFLDIVPPYGLVLKNELIRRGYNRRDFRVIGRKHIKSGSVPEPNYQVNGHYKYT